jgi:stage IV sporulation protein FB
VAHDSVPQPSPPSTTRTAGRSWSFPIGRIAGIELRVHVTFFLLVALFAAAGTEPGGPGALASVGWLFIIFACVVAHELAHCFVGRAKGAVVEEIVLLPIGGVSKLEKLPGTPRAELEMAIAGPAASILLAAIAGGVAVLVQQPLIPIDLYAGSLVSRIFWFNLLIAGFNLLPAFPLDGGRVFRALLEERYDLVRSTRIAARLGRAVAITLVVVGIFFNVWLVIIGVFVYLGASAEEAATIVHVRLEHHVVGDAMLLEPLVVSPTTSVDDLRALLRRSAQRVFPIVGELGYIGLVDSWSIERATRNQRAVDLAERATRVIAATDGLEDDLPLVVSAPARALAVVDDAQRIVGVLRLEDVQHLVATEDLPDTHSDHTWMP